MPLTAYSISEKKELDLQQVLFVLSQRSGRNEPVSAVDVPDSWREFLRSDLECPCCFVTGADLVREGISRTSKKTVKQACFRFVNPGHHPDCDYASRDSTNFIPENLVEFGKANTNVTKAVRELVCTGIEIGAFSQKSIRDMREWFFQKKINARFLVTLDARVPRWVENLRRTVNLSYGHIPSGISLTTEIAAMPGFNWSMESARVLAERHRAILDIIQTNQIWIHDVVGRIEALAKRHHNQLVFDPTALQSEYSQSLTLARFISHNYAPLKHGLKNKKPWEVEPHVLALSALILFVTNWQLQEAVGMFAAISASAGRADQSLGNVMGLNPFHDYEAWSKLRKLQDAGIQVPNESDPSVERKEIEEQLRGRFLSQYDGNMN